GYPDVTCRHAGSRSSTQQEGTMLRCRQYFLVGAALLSLMTIARADDDRDDRHRRVDHVLLISVDGMHEVDLQRWIKNHPEGALAELAERGTTYTNAFTSAPSDSFPGLLAQVTGGTPFSTGVFYDDAYDRVLFAPGSNCIGSPGTEMAYAENLDFSLADVTG